MDPMLQSNAYTSKNSFVYQSQIASALANGQSTTSTFNIDGDSDFFWQKFTCHATVGNDGTTNALIEVPEVNIIITNTTSGRQYMNQAVPLYDMAGSGQLPFILPMVTYFPAKSTIKIDYQNASDNKTYSTLYLSFIGIKAFLAKS